MINKDLVNKYLAGDASQKEKEAIQLWLESNKKNREEFRSLRILYDISLGSLPEEKNNPVINREKKRKRLSELLKIAAAILITFTCTYSFLQFQKDKHPASGIVAMQTIHVPAGQRAELTLSDSTKVWLNSLTTFIFPSQFTDTGREVYLDGEGYFDVAHDAGRQFKINTHDHVIKVLGTEFNVTAYSKENDFFTTSLIDGAVEINSHNNDQNISLTPGNQAYLKDGRLMVSPIQHYDYFLWKKGIISFNHEQLKDILKKLELYYDIRIENRNKHIENIRYTGKFRTKDGIEHVLNVLQVPTGLHYEKNNEENIIRIY